MSRVPFARGSHGLGRREFLDRARRYAVSGIAAGAAFDVLGGVPGAKALFMTVWRPSTRSAENSYGIRQG